MGILLYKLILNGLGGIGVFEHGVMVKNEQNNLRVVICPLGMCDLYADHAFM